MTKRGCVVTGVESDPEMAKIAEQHCSRMLVGDAEQLDFSKLGKYDAIVLGDVVEHLRNPQQFLKSMAQLLKPGGKVLMSLPNVANIWVRLNLLFGRFNYSRVGILDETHLRFFTLASSKRIAQDSGFEILSTSVTPIPLPFDPSRYQQGSNLKLSTHSELGFDQAQKNAVWLSIYFGMPA